MLKNLELHVMELQQSNLRLVNRRKYIKEVVLEAPGGNNQQKTKLGRFIANSQVPSAEELRKLYYSILATLSKKEVNCEFVGSGSLPVWLKAQTTTDYV